MVSPQMTGKELVTGMKLTLEEFLIRWEAIPELKKAELIDGVVYVPSPVSIEHDNRDLKIHGWLDRFAEETPGCDCGSNGTWKMLGQSPQPDSYLRILESHGGTSPDKTKYHEGAPELAIEICVSSSKLEFGPKLALFERAGVLEYMTVEPETKRVVWRALVDGSYQTMEPDADCILRSRCFPGLWLDTSAYWAGDRKQMTRTLKAGLATPEHAQFVEELARRAAALKA